MFYNHDILTDRKHGVATIWLVATLGSKSSLRKVTRKAIMDVNVPNACDTITDPSSPLALRLQGNLLYGVSRVFSQQCAYVLTDMQSLRDKMRGITMLLRELEIDPDVSATRPEQLNLQEDPAFSIELDLGFELSSFDLNSSSEEPSSLLSPRTSISSRSSILPDNEFGLAERTPLYNSSSHEGGGLAIVDTTDAPGAHKPAQAQTLDADIGIADDGMQYLDDGGVLLQEASVIETVDLPTLPEPEGDVNFDDFVQPEQDEPIQHDDQPDIFDYGDEHPILQDQPLQNSSPTTQQPNDANVSESVEEDGVTQPDPETIIMARVAPHRVMQTKTIPRDDPAELQNRVLGEWGDNYLDIMEDARKEHASKISVAQAKRNAAYWVLDQGIGGVSADFREDDDEHPLAVFSGQELLDMFGYTEAETITRKRSASDLTDEEDRRVRPRSDDDQPAMYGEQDDNVAHVHEDELPGSHEYDETDHGPEVGRAPQEALSDQPDTLMPWNIYASSRQGSRQGSVRPPMSAAGVSSSAGGPGAFDFMPLSLGSKRTSRLLQESPLERRQLLHQLSREGVDDDTFGLDDTIALDRQIAANLENVADFELRATATPEGPTTQQATDSQWLAASLEKEAMNFRSFLATTIEGKRNDGEGTVVTFEELLPLQSNSHIVAAQGLLHVLSLATKGLVDVLQEVAFGDIEMSMVEVKTPEVEAV